MQKKIDLSKPTFLPFIAPSCVGKDFLATVLSREFTKEGIPTQPVVNEMTRELRSGENSDYNRQISKEEFFAKKKEGQYLSATSNTYKKDDGSVETIYYGTPKEYLYPGSIYTGYGTRQSIEQNPIDESLYNVFRVYLDLPESERISRASRRIRKEIVNLFYKRTGKIIEDIPSDYLDLETQKFLDKRRFFDNTIKGISYDERFKDKYTIFTLDNSLDIEERVSILKHHLGL